MNKIFRLVAGMTSFKMLLLPILWTSILTMIPNYYNFSPIDRINMFSRAEEIMPCEIPILNSLGDLYFNSNNPTVAALKYGKAMICSPGNSFIRLKYGESLLMMGFDGRSHMLDAISLEPNNPLYKKEYERINGLVQTNVIQLPNTQPQSPSQSH